MLMSVRLYLLVVSGWLSGCRPLSRSAFRVTLRAIERLDDGSGKGWAPSVGRFELMLLVFSLRKLSCDAYLLLCLALGLFL